MFEFGSALPVEDVVWWNRAVVRGQLVKGGERDGRCLCAPDLWDAYRRGKAVAVW